MTTSIVQTSSTTLVDLASGTTYEYQAGSSRTLIQPPGQSALYVPDLGTPGGVFQTLLAATSINVTLVSAGTDTLAISDTGAWLEKTGGGSSIALHLSGGTISLPDSGGTVFAILNAAKLV